MSFLRQIRNSVLKKKIVSIPSVRLLIARSPFDPRLAGHGIVSLSKALHLSCLALFQSRKPSGMADLGSNNTGHWSRLLLPTGAVESIYSKSTGRILCRKIIILKSDFWISLNTFLDIQNYAEFWISINRIMDIQKLNY